MTSDWQQIACPKCQGNGWLTVGKSSDNGRLCPTCRGAGKLVAETSIEKSLMTFQSVLLSWITANWSLVSGAIAAGLAAYASNPSLQVALMAIASYLLGRSGGVTSANATIKAHLARKSS